MHELVTFLLGSHLVYAGSSSHWPSRGMELLRDP